jgi:hypothetical protein
MVLQPTGPIETTMCDYETIESVNNELYHNLRDLVNTPFFKYFQVRRLLIYQSLDLTCNCTWYRWIYIASAHSGRRMGRA